MPGVPRDAQDAGGSKLDARYRLNAPEVVTETLDGEALIVHLTSGCYYSCRGIGEAVWARLLAGDTADEAANALASSFSVAAARVEDDVRTFLAQVIEEGLLVESAVAPDGSTAPASLVTGEYAPPVLERYTDMQELLALDPVHDIEKTEGWPVLPQPGAQKAL
ncbi:MAG: PqqD family protein [Tepidiformaceae bacterium]